MTPFSTPAERIPRCMFVANLVIPAQMYDKLSGGQGKVHGQMDGQTDEWMPATTIPLRPESRAVKWPAFYNLIWRALDAKCSETSPGFFVQVSLS